MLPKQYKMPDGTLKTALDLAQDLNLSLYTIRNRLKKNGYKITADVLKPRRRFKQYKMPDGSFKTVPEIAKELNLARSTIDKRLRRNDYIVDSNILFPSHNKKCFIKDAKFGKIYLTQIAEDNDLPYKLVYERYSRGKKTYAELSKPSQRKSEDETPEQLKTLKEFKRITANDRY